MQWVASTTQGPGVGRFSTLARFIRIRLLLTLRGSHDSDDSVVVQACPHYVAAQTTIYTSGKVEYFLCFRRGRGASSTMTVRLNCSIIFMITLVDN